MQENISNELMHINLYWSLTGSSLLVPARCDKNTRSVFASAAQHSVCMTALLAFVP